MRCYSNIHSKSRGLASVAHLNPLLGVNIAAKSPIEQQATAGKPKSKEAVAHFKQLPGSPKKLRAVANLVRGLYVREAMLQLEFCKKHMAVMVKNAVENAVHNGSMRGLTPNRMIIKSISVGQGSYSKGLDYKSKGRSGVKRGYKSHIRVVVEEVSRERLCATPFFGRWQKASSLLEVPWEERIKQLPRYKPIPGYVPGERRIPLLPIIPKKLAKEKR